MLIDRILSTPTSHNSYSFDKLSYQELQELATFLNNNKGSSVTNKITTSMQALLDAVASA